MAQSPADMDWAALVDRVEHSHYDQRLSFGMMLRAQVRVVELHPGRLAYEQAPGFPDDITAVIKTGLQKALGDYWEVERRPDGGAPSLVEAEQARGADERAALMASPLVAAALAAFPQAQFIEEERGGSDQNRPFPARSGGFRR